MRFVLATQHFSGLGFGLRLLDEGHEVIAAFASIDDRRLEQRHALLGQGMLDRRPIDDVMRDREQFRDAYWVWDENHSVAANETLRAEGFRVLGGGQYPDTMEHDRQACLAFVEEHGLVPPPSHSFTDVARRSHSWSRTRIGRWATTTR